MKVHLMVLGFVAMSAIMAGSAYALPTDITLSPPTVVDMNGHQKTSINADEPVGFSSVITNHSTEEKRFTYMVRIADENNVTKFQEGFSSNIASSQSFTVAESWIPQIAGTYTVQTFITNGYTVSNQPNDVIQTVITVK